MHLSAKLAIAMLLLVVVPRAEAQFDWGGCGGNGGSGAFNQPVALGAVLNVGEIISGLRDVKIHLRSQTDIDVQLYDQTSGAALVKWPDGWLNGPTQQTLSYGGVTITWSGYNGDGTGWGNEYIQISGTTNRSYIMKVYGFQSGSAAVTYSWVGGGSEGGNCNGGSGSGTFQQPIAYRDTVTVGEIPAGLDDVYIALSAKDDVDVQLYDSATGTAIVAWPSGLMSGPGPQTRTYQGMRFVWSGYDGDQVPERRGYEFIAIHGKTTRKLLMRAYGYESGHARVDYEWGKRFVIYTGIRGGNQGDISDNNTTSVIAAGCNDIRNRIADELPNRTVDPDNDGDLRDVGASGIGGQFAIGLRVACGATFQGDSWAGIYPAGNSTLIKLDIEQKHNANKRARVYLSGFSAGGGDLQNLIFKVRDLGIKVQASAHIDSVEFGADARIPDNVRRAMGFYQKQSSWLVHGEDFLWASDSSKTFITNTRIDDSSGPESVATWGANAYHMNMDNDARTWVPLVDYINLHR